MNRKNKSTEETNSQIEFPWFLLGFIGLSILGSYVLGPVIPKLNYFVEFVSSLTTWLLTAAMTIVSIALSVLTYFTI